MKIFKTYSLKIKVLRFFQGFSRLGYIALYRTLQNLSSPSNELLLTSSWIYHLPFVLF